MRLVAIRLMRAKEMYLVAALLAFGLHVSLGACPADRGCFPVSGNIAFGRTIFANSTCGDPPNTFEITQVGGNIVDVCDASDPDKSHPATLANDNNDTTRWQAEELEHFVTLQLDFTFPMRLENSIITFRSFRPRRMILEKSSDYGASWTPYQFYDAFCTPPTIVPDGLFQDIMEGTRGNFPSDSIEAFCLDDDSSPGTPLEFGTVSFLAVERFGNNRFDDETIIDHLVVTNLRARFRSLYTAGDTTDPQTARAFYYSVTEWNVEGYCHCNGHAETCVRRDNEPNPEGKILSGCDCQHNTEGDNCERCKPLFNNKPYRAGNSTHPNECEICECNGHAESCTYNESKGHGVCDCMDNTCGDSCDQCCPGFFRDATDNCVACNCSGAGSLSPQCNATGHCDCKANVSGMKCDQCSEGFFNLSNPNGCQACHCNAGGSLNLSCTEDGECFCKPDIIGQKCDQCAGNFFLNDTTCSCVACGCLESTATSLQCDSTGQCPCKTGLTGRTCGTIANGNWLPFLEGIVYEAEEAMRSGGATIENRFSNPKLFTGTGGVRLSNGGQITFDVRVPLREISYILNFRYEAMGPFSNVVVEVNDTEVFGGTVPNASNADNPFPSLPVSLIPGSYVTVVFRYNGGDPADNPKGIFVDSLVLLPALEDLLEYQNLGLVDQSLIETFCYNPRKTVPTLSDTNTNIANCEDFIIQVNSALFNGSLDCDCGNGTKNCSGLCDKLGGQCPCASSVTTRTCSVCEVSFFGLDCDGCDDCNCHPNGTTEASLGSCDELGQCICKPNVTGLKCDTLLCEDGFFSTGNLSECEPCGCSLSTAISMVCDSTGQCPCKTGLTGLTCGTIANGNWLPFLEGIVYEAEEAMLSEGATIENRLSDPELFTGTGGVRLSNGSQITFHVRVPLRETSYVLNFRYETVVAFSRVIVELNNAGVFVGALPDAPNANNPLQISQTDLIPGSNVRVVFKYSGDDPADDPKGIFVDSLVLLPVLEELLEYQNLSFIEQSLLGTFCYNPRQAVPTLSNTDTTIANCEDFTIRVNSALFNGSLECGCANGTENCSALCDKLGGQCPCASNVVTRTCSVCEFTFFGLDCDGCQACTCNTTGSMSQQCNETGVCECHPNVDGTKCDMCGTGFFNFSSNNPDVCEDCGCKSDFSVSPQCNDTGVCSCKTGIGGDTCDVCLDRFFGISMSGCSECNCSMEGSVNNFCNKTDGQCECLKGVIGRACDKCDLGFFGLGFQGNGCRMCNCSGFSTDCTLATSAVSASQENCTCPSQFQGFSCEECSSGFKREIPGGNVTVQCVPCECNNHSELCDASSGVCMNCTGNTEGDFCESCKDEFFGNAQTGDCISCDCDPVGSTSPVCSKWGGACSCHATFGGPDDRTCSLCKDGFFNKTAGCVMCECNVTQTINGSNICNRETGQCPCDTGFGGLTCNICGKGFQGDVPNCINCGDCFYNWTMLIEELVNKTNAEYQRFQDIVQQHYGPLTVEQLTNNVTTLRDFLMMIIDSLDASTTAISDKLTALRMNLSDMNVNDTINMQMALYQHVKTTLDHVDAILMRTNDFNGTVTLLNGKVVNSQSLTDLAIQLNDSSNEALESSATRLDEVKTNKSLVSDAEALANVAQMTVNEALTIAEHAANATAATRVLELEFRELYENNTKKLMSLIIDRDAISENLGMYLEEAQNATKAAMAANSTASNAWTLANQKLANAVTDNDTASEIKSNASVAFNAACEVYNDTTDAKERAISANGTANLVLHSIAAAETMLKDQDDVLLSITNTTNKTLALSLPPLDEITDLSRQINETIIPESIVNETIDDANEAYRRAMEVDEVSRKALNVSKQAAEFVDGIETNIAAAEENQTAAEGKIKETEAVIAEVHDIKADVNATTDQIHIIAGESMDIAGQALSTVKMVEECRNNVITELVDANKMASTACSITGPEVLMNATRVHNKAFELNASVAVEKAEEDLNLAGSLLSESQSLQQSVSNSDLIQALMELLNDYTSQKQELMGKTTRLEELDQELDELEGQLEHLCGSS